MHPFPTLPPPRSQPTLLFASSLQLNGHFLYTKQSLSFLGGVQLKPQPLARSFFCQFASSASFYVVSQEPLLSPSQVAAPPTVKFSASVSDQSPR